MYTKLENIDEGATKTIIGVSSPITSRNPVPADNTTATIILGHAESTANGSYGSDSATEATLTFGQSFLLPGFTVDATGHVSGAHTQILHIPNSVVDGSHNGLMSTTDKTKLEGIAEGAQIGTVTSVATGVGLTGGPITGSGTIGLNLISSTPLSETGVNLPATLNEDRVYNVRLDQASKLAVYVPWVEYNLVTGSNDGLMSSTDKSRLDAMSDNATSTSYSATLTSGQAIGTLTIDGTDHVLYTHNPVPAMTGASASAAGAAGYIGTAPAAGQQNYYLSGDGYWKGVPSSSQEQGLFTNTEKTKLANIEESATNLSLHSDNIIVLKNADSDATITTSPQTNLATGRVKITHADAAVSGTFGTLATTQLEPDFGATFIVPGLKFNSTGHISEAGVHNVKIPETVADGSHNGLMSSGMYTKLQGIDSGATHIERIDDSSPISASISQGVISISHDAPTQNYSSGSYPATPSNGDIAFVTGQNKYKFEVPYFSTNSTGHISSAGMREVYIPMASTSNAGLISSTDQTKLSNSLRIESLTGDPVINISNDGNGS